MSEEKFSMKRTLAAVFVCAFLLFSLTACGEDTAAGTMDHAMDEAGDMLDEAGDVMDEAVTGTERAVGRSGRDSSGNTGAMQEENGRERYGSVERNTNATANATLRGSYNNPTGTPGGSRNYVPEQDEQDDPAAPKTRWQLMLDNAHVRDSDGYLLDGENPQNDTF